MDYEEKKKNYEEYLELKEKILKLMERIKKNEEKIRILQEIKEKHGICSFGTRSVGEMEGFCE